MKKSLTLIILLQSCICMAQTQFNDSVTHMVKLASSGSLNNTEDGVTYLLNNSAQYSVKKKRFVLNSNSSWIYGDALKVLTNNDFVSTLDFNLYDRKYKNFYYWGLVNFTSSFSLKINEQLQNGLGLAYRFINKDWMMLSISDGIIYERSNLILEDSTKLKYATFRNSLRIQFNAKYKDLIAFTSQGFWQPSLSYGDDYILTANASLSVKIWKWLSLNSTVNYNKLSRTNKENFTLTYGIVAQRFF
jgi:hypothetical protein